MTDLALQTLLGRYSVGIKHLGEPGPSDEQLALMAQAALRAPVTVAIVARIDMAHPIAPGHEQWMAVGGAVSNFLFAAHALGFAGKMLSGAKVRWPAVVAAFCEQGEMLVGWVSLGTALRVSTAKHDKPAPEALLRAWCP